MMKSLALLVLLLSASAHAADLDVPAGTFEDERSLAAAMPSLAERLIPTLHDDARDPHLNALFRLQLVAGRYQEALANIRELRELRKDADPGRASTLFIQYEVFAGARLIETSRGVPFAEALRQSYREVFQRLDDKTANDAEFSFGGNLQAMHDDLTKLLVAHKGDARIAEGDAVDVVRKYQVWMVYQSLLPRVPQLVAEDAGRRYLVDESLVIRTHDGATLSAIVVRPRSTTKPLPALLNFTIYVDHAWKLNDAKRNAANGYVGVVVYARGKDRSPDAPVPYEHDGSDANDAIDWISHQPWSDGRVAMFGGSYEGFTQWAAAKYRHPALRAIMPSVSVAPGIDVPMEGNVFLTFPYRWLPYVMNTKGLDEAANNDAGRWSAMNRKWYLGGGAYRDLDHVDGIPSPIFRRWLSHPSYDAYWRAMIPYGEGFAHIDIPVLATTGYYDGALAGAMYYLAGHTLYNPHATHFLVVGPWDHIGAQRRPANVLNGYAIDPVAQVDIEQLRYDWFDYVLRGGPKPAMLAANINYEVMGANEWKHAPSLAAMSNATLRFHLSAGHGHHHRLAAKAPQRSGFVRQIVDLRDRTDVDRSDIANIIDSHVDDRNGLVFMSDPLAKPTEISGLFSGTLDFVANRKDVDLSVSLYEWNAKGEYFALSYWLGRASYAKDRTRRVLLVPGARSRLQFRSLRLTSRLLPAGSRIVAVLAVNKRPDGQINYGTGRDVSDETIVDAKKPLRIRWYGSSVLDIPIWR